MGSNPAWRTISTREASEIGSFLFAFSFRKLLILLNKSINKRSINKRFEARFFAVSVSLSVSLGLAGKKNEVTELRYSQTGETIVASRLVFSKIPTADNEDVGNPSNGSKKEQCDASLST